MAEFPVFKPNIPFLGRIPELSTPGDMVIIKGRIKGRDKRFARLFMLNSVQKLIHILALKVGGPY